jgi:hypothetical protein
VGKTTTCRLEGTDYLNRDNADDRRLILRGPGAVAQHLGPFGSMVVFLSPSCGVSPVSASAGEH